MTPATTAPSAMTRHRIANTTDLDEVARRADRSDWADAEASGALGRGGDEAVLWGLTAGRPAGSEVLMAEPDPGGIARVAAEPSIRGNGGRLLGCAMGAAVASAAPGTGGIAVVAASVAAAGGVGFAADAGAAPAPRSAPDGRPSGAPIGVAAFGLAAHAAPWLAARLAV
jgi:hypothetical protein